MPLLFSSSFLALLLVDKLRPVVGIHLPVAELTVNSKEEGAYYVSSKEFVFHSTCKVQIVRVFQRQCRIALVAVESRFAEGI